MEFSRSLVYFSLLIGDNGRLVQIYGLKDMDGIHFGIWLAGRYVSRDRDDEDSNENKSKLSKMPGS